MKTSPLFFFNQKSGETGRSFLFYLNFHFCGPSGLWLLHEQLMDFKMRAHLGFLCKAKAVPLQAWSGPEGSQK